MTIYYIAVSSWDGRAYTFDYIIPFSLKENRDKHFDMMKNSKTWGNADFYLTVGEEDII